MRRLLVVLLGSFPLAAQATHLVGPGGLPNVADALAIAAPGDIVLVEPGTYAGFTANVGVTIRALGTVLVGSTVCSPPPGQTLHLVGLDVPLGTVAITTGRVTMAACTVSIAGAQPAGSAALSVTGADVHLLDCAFGSALTNAHTPALRATGARIAAVNTTFTATEFIAPPPAVMVTGGQFHASRCTVSTAAFTYPGAAGLYASGNAIVWLCDSGVYGALGSCPIEAPAATVRISRTSLSPTSGANCAAIQSGPGLLGMEQVTPPQSGTTFTLKFHAGPFQLVALHASTDLGSTPLPGFEQPAALSLAEFWPVGIYVTDANGIGTVSWDLPAGMFVDTPLWLEAITGPSWPLQVAPLAGGVIR